MKARTERPLDVAAVAAVLGGWRGAAPTAGFADRVLAALEPREAAAARPSRRPLLWFAALAAAVVLLPLVFLHGASGLAPTPGIATVEADLGIQRD